MVCALPQAPAVRGLFLFPGCKLGIGLKLSAQGAAKPYVVETEDWGAAANIPLLVPSRDFIALKLQLEAMAAAARCVTQGASPMPSYVEILTCLELSDEAAPLGPRPMRLSALSPKAPPFRGRKSTSSCRHEKNIA
jgi:hypothetical protein